MNDHPERRYHMKGDREILLRSLGSKNAIEVLEFLDEHGATHYRDMMDIFNTYTLNHRLHELISFNLVEHHFERTLTRKEWYEITEKGRKVLELLKGIEAVVL